ncbi:MAG: hypothetical protein K9K32_07480 [Halanaerobiales bacterium]|nr:hypothetical protein [Halanaerobiales bacterium]
MGNQKYSDEELINKLKRFARDINKTPSQIDFKKYNFDYLPSFDTYAKRFGKYSIACKKANLKPNNGFNNKKSDRILLDDLIWLSEKQGGITPTIEEMVMLNNLSSPRTCIKRFGSWKNAIEKAGLKYNEKNRDYNPKFALHLLKEKINKSQKILSPKEINQSNILPDISFYKYHFKTLKDTYKKIGLDKNAQNLIKFTNDLLNKSNNFNDLLNKVVKNQEAIKLWYKKYSKLLTCRQKDIIDRRYGLTGNKKITLKAIGSDYSLCRERVRQLQNKALNKLKYYKRLNELKNILKG